MSVKENKALARRLIDAINTRNWGLIDEVMAPGYIDHYALPGQKTGREGYKEGLISFTNAFPDFQFTIDDMVAEEDKVAIRFTMTGTHKGEIVGILPTNKRITYTHIHIFRYVSGKIVEDWGFGDRLGFFQQVGTMPPIRFGK